MSRLDDVLAQIGGEAAGWVQRNREHLAQIPEAALRASIGALADGRPVDAEVELYRSLNLEQRRRYRAESLEQLRAAVDARLSAVAVITDALETLGSLGASLLLGALDDLLGALLEAASDVGGSASA